jgi:hypothetical protein
MLPVNSGQPHFSVGNMQLAVIEKPNTLTLIVKEQDKVINLPAIVD